MDPHTDTSHARETTHEDPPKVEPATGDLTILNPTSEVPSPVSLHFSADETKFLLPLKITIVGAGLGGLATAYLLGKAGHLVTVLESAENVSDIGAGIQLSPNMTRLLIRWGLGNQLKEVAVTPQGLNLRRYADGEIVGSQIWGESIEKEHGSPYYHFHRADLYRILLEIAEPLSSIRFSTKVVDVDPATATVTLASGEVVAGDLVIGADGIHSHMRDAVVGRKDNPQPTGDAAYRAVIPADLLLADPDLKEFVEEPCVNVWMGPGRHAIGYCIRSQKLYNLVMIHPARNEEEEVRDANVDVARADFANFEPRVRKLLELASPITVWSLMDRQPLSSWIHESGKICLLGDSCHPMLPYVAQGAAMAIEDAAVLGKLLSKITDKEQLPTLLKGYQELRHGRASNAQFASRVNQRLFHYEDGPEQQARDASMRDATKASIRAAQGEGAEDSAESQNLKRVRASFGYDADAEVEQWITKHWGRTGS